MTPFGSAVDPEVYCRKATSLGQGVKGSMMSSFVYVRRIWKGGHEKSERVSHRVDERIRGGEPGALFIHDSLTLSVHTVRRLGQFAAVVKPT